MTSLAGMLFSHHSSSGPRSRALPLASGSTLPAPAMPTTHSKAPGAGAPVPDSLRTRRGGGLRRSWATAISWRSLDTASERAMSWYRPCSGCKSRSVMLPARPRRPVPEGKLSQPSRSVLASLRDRRYYIAGGKAAASTLALRLALIHYAASARLSQSAKSAACPDRVILQQDAPYAPTVLLSDCISVRGGHDPSRRSRVRQILLRQRTGPNEPSRQGDLCLFRLQQRLTLPNDLKGIRKDQPLEEGVPDRDLRHDATFRRNWRAAEKFLEDAARKLPFVRSPFALCSLCS